jgi:hypothetical protein
MGEIAGTRTAAPPRAISLDSRSAISRIDRQGMLDLVAGFAAQCEEAMQIGQKAHGCSAPSSRCVGVLGRSAIADDLLRCYLADDRRTVLTVRNYQLPRGGAGAGHLLELLGSTEERSPLRGRAARGRASSASRPGQAGRKCGRDGVPGSGPGRSAAPGGPRLPVHRCSPPCGVSKCRLGKLDELLGRVREAGSAARWRSRRRATSPSSSPGASRIVSW